MDDMKDFLASSMAYEVASTLDETCPGALAEMERAMDAFPERLLESAVENRTMIVLFATALTLVANLNSSLMINKLSAHLFRMGWEAAERHYEIVTDNETGKFDWDLLDGLNL